MSSSPYLEHKKTTSWSAIFAGVVSTLAILILFSFLSTALGFQTLNPYGNNPFAGIGMAVGISSVIGLIIALIIGGFIAGRLAGANGAIHGFLTWCAVLLVGAIITTMSLAGAARIGASAVSNTSSAIGSVAGNTVSLSDNIAQSFGSSLHDLIGDQNSDVNSDDIRQKLDQILKNTNIPQLQPENLRSVLDATRQDVRNAVNAIRYNPSNYQKIIDNLMSSIEERAKGLTANINKQDVITALENNGMTPAEAQTAANSAINLYNNRSEIIQNQINTMRQTIAETQTYMKQLADEAQAKADIASDAIARGSWMAFIGSILGAIIAAFAGMIGLRSRKDMAV
ncbi:hypothetical protein [Bartonella sp. HY761]|uniref:hypothetical protein n=1 Tax=Bartonella sp. HY761 TaxID=2979330 RepID=UPI0022098A94|nr:hypothetical protein [Bartonella sp. HY761]UXN05317.1 hypothetical protein N6A79_08280 [Bartonella sp. HY761]